MPTYEYQCKTCGNRFDYFQAISAEALTHCPVDICFLEDEEKKGTGDVQRRISGGAGLVFKGEGFYLTDYVRKGDGNRSEGKKGGESSSGDKGTKSQGSSGDSESSGSGSSGSGSSDKSGSGTSSGSDSKE